MARIRTRHMLMVGCCEGGVGFLVLLGHCRARLCKELHQKKGQATKTRENKSQATSKNYEKTNAAAIIKTKRAASLITWGCLPCLFLMPSLIQRGQQEVICTGFSKSLFQTATEVRSMIPPALARSRALLSRRSKLATHPWGLSHTAAPPLREQRPHDKRPLSPAAPRHRGPPRLIWLWLVSEAGTGRQKSRVATRLWRA